MILPLSVMIFGSCKPAKRIQKTNLLLDKNIIIQNGSKLNYDDLHGIIKQRTNVYSLTKVRVRLHVHNLGHPNRIQRVSERLDKKTAAKNEKICDNNDARIDKGEAKIKAGKKVKGIRQKKLKSRRKVLGEVFHSAGEAPILLDSSLMTKSIDQIKLFMFKKGYFNASVQDSIAIGKKLARLKKLEKKGDTAKIKSYYAKKKNLNRATVYYVINSGAASKIDCFVHEIEKNDHGEIHKFIDQLAPASLIKVGDRFDMDLLEMERVRLTVALRDSGFHFFNKEYLYFEYDTTVTSNRVDLYMGIHNIKSKNIFSDTILLTPHKRFTVDSIEIITNYDSRIQSTTYSTIHYKDFKYLYRNELKFRPQLLDKRIKYRMGEYYNHSKIEASFKKLSGLGVFKIIHIDFKVDTTEGKVNSLKSIIELEPTKSKTFTLNSDGTHSDGLLGLEGSIVMSNKNLFKRAIKGQISFTGGLEAQRSIVETDDGGSTDDLTGLVNTFNTLEFSPAASITIPAYLFRLTGLLDHHTNPHTELTSAYNFQKRPDFTRNIFSLTGATVVNEKKGHLLRLDWPEFSVVNIYDESDAFLSRINDLNDKLLAASYRDHIISAARFSYEYNGQKIGKLKNNLYFKSTIEQSGNLLRWGFERTNRPIDSLGGYEIFGTRFAQYVKSTIDLRYYRNFKKSQVVYRVFAGMGVPLENFKEALPFEKSFYAGGANGNRAWKARTLGPGSHLDSARAFDKTGDIMFEMNAEVRFDIIDWIEGALFADVGNIWLLKPDSLRPKGHFDFRRSIPRELALGGGFGIRMDLDFFLIRLDLALPFHNPALGDGDRWVFGRYRDLQDFYKPQFVLGIGYPF
ncbi:MAG: BamA/TamA family outer membrane protein [Flavobacteriales bacterium]|nr:BamA/TamA family outer membrane protein [Flavobacteriales bacterium]